MPEYGYLVPIWFLDIVTPIRHHLAPRITRHLIPRHISLQSNLRNAGQSYQALFANVRVPSSSLRKIPTGESCRRISRCLTNLHSTNILTEREAPLYALRKLLPSFSAASRAGVFPAMCQSPTIAYPLAHCIWADIRKHPFCSRWKRLTPRNQFAGVEGLPNVICVRVQSQAFSMKGVANRPPLQVSRLLSPHHRLAPSCNEIVR